MSKIIEHNVETGEIIERDLTENELIQQAIDAKAEEERIANALAQAAAKAALLERLGITEEEAKLLLG